LVKTLYFNIILELLNKLLKKKFNLNDCKLSVSARTHDQKFIVIFFQVTKKKKKVLQAFAFYRLINFAGTKLHCVINVLMSNTKL
jgi:hypothetical protein